MNTQCIKECCIAFHHFYKPEIIWQYIATSICALLQGSITWFSYNQWRRLHGARGTCPHFYRWLHGDGCTVSRRTANKKLTKLHWPSRKRSPKRLIVLLEPKSGVTRPKIFFFRRFASDRCPHFQIRCGATIYIGIISAQVTASMHFHVYPILCSRNA